MKYTPQEAKVINRTSHEITNRYYGRLFTLVLTDPNQINQFKKSMNEVKLPYVDGSGTLLYQDLTEICLTRTLEEKIEKMESILAKVKAITSKS